MISEQLLDSIKVKRSPVVVGLDPRLENIPEEILTKMIVLYGESLKAAAETIIEFNKGIIDAVYDLVPAVKPQIAFYEQYGLEGLRAYCETCNYAKDKGLIVIGDVKRGDIGTTSKAYSQAHLGKVKVGSSIFTTFETDLITVNPYLGDDCLIEFMEEVKLYEKGLFVLVKTSNKSSGQLQDLKVEKENAQDSAVTVYDTVAKLVNAWNENFTDKYGYSPIGAVVGATYPEELIKLRREMPKAIFLVPGYGAQGGGAKDVVHAFNSDGLGALINASRSITYAYEKTGENYRTAARNEVLKMNKDINHALELDGKKYW